MFGVPAGPTRAAADWDAAGRGASDTGVGAETRYPGGGDSQCLAFVADIAAAADAH